MVLSLYNLHFDGGTSFEVINIYTLYESELGLPIERHRRA